MSKKINIASRIASLTSTDPRRIRLSYDWNSAMEQEKKSLFQSIWECLLDLCPPGFDWEDLDAIAEWDKQCLETAGRCHIEAFYILQPYYGMSFYDLIEYVVTPPEGETFTIKRLAKASPEQHFALLDRFMGAGWPGLRRDIAEKLAQRDARERKHQASA